MKRALVFCLSSVTFLAGCSGGGTSGTSSGSGTGPGRGTGANPEPGSGTGSGSGSGSVDLEAKDYLWLATRGGDAFVLHTWKEDVKVLLDVKDTPKGPTKNQYEGSRQDNGDGLVLNLSCINPMVKGASFDCPLGNETGLACTFTSSSKPQLLCGDYVFDQVEDSDIHE